jgi:branched-chain amino acid transport system substrate-binding protein
MKTIVSILVLILLIVVAAVWFATRQEQPPRREETVQETPAREDTPSDNGNAEDMIRIGAISAKTGAASEVNKFMFVALRDAVEEINQRGGILGKQVKLIEFDNRSTPLGSKEAAQKAVVAKVVGVIGALRSSHSLAMGSVLQAAKIPMISPESTNPKVTLVGDYVFRTCFTDPFQGVVLANFARNEIAAKTAVTITNANRIYSIELSKIFTTSFEKLGGKVLYNGDYLDTAIDYNRILTKVKELKPDVIMIPSEVRDSGFIIKQARKMGITSNFLGSDAWSVRMFRFAGEAAEGSFFSTHWHDERDTAKSRAFVKAYTAKEGAILRSGTPLAYDALALLVNAIERAGTTDGPAVRDALASTRDFEGITGTITFNDHGDPINKAAVILKLSNGKAIYHKTIEP